MCTFFVIVLILNYEKNFSLIAAVEKWVIQKWGDVRYMPKNVVPELEYF